MKMENYTAVLYCGTLLSI